MESFFSGLDFENTDSKFQDSKELDVEEDGLSCILDLYSPGCGKPSRGVRQPLDFLTFDIDGPFCTFRSDYAAQSNTIVSDTSIADSGYSSLFHENEVEVPSDAQTIATPRTTVCTPRKESAIHICGRCKRTFKKLVTLENHLQRCSTPMCTLCRATFSSVASLRRHERVGRACQRNMTRMESELIIKEQPPSVKNREDTFESARQAKKQKLEICLPDARPSPPSAIEMDLQGLLQAYDPLEPQADDALAGHPANIDARVEDLAFTDERLPPIYIKTWADNIGTPSTDPVGSTPSSRLLDSEEESFDSGSDGFTLTEYGEWPEWDPHGDILSTLKPQYINQLIDEFQQWRKCPMESQPGETSSQSGDKTPEKNSAGSNTSGNSSTRPGSNKRKRDSTDDNDDCDEEDKPQQKSPSTVNDCENNLTLIFACPFTKRYPGKYTKCCALNLMDVSRVKQHLCRATCHIMPKYCPICFETFPKEDVRDEHIQARTCSRQPPRKWEGISDSQREELSKRPRPGSTPRQLWNSIYRILFPGAPLPDNPYVEASCAKELRAFRRFSRTHGHRILKDIVRSLPPGPLRDLLTQDPEDLQPGVVNFFGDAVVRLIDVYNLTGARRESIEEPTPERQPGVADAEPREFAGPDELVGSINHRRRPAADATDAASLDGSDSALGTSIADFNQNPANLEKPPNKTKSSKEKASPTSAIYNVENAVVQNPHPLQPAVGPRQPQFNHTPNIMQQPSLPHNSQFPLSQQMLPFTPYAVPGTFPSQYQIAPHWGVNPMNNMNWGFEQNGFAANYQPLTPGFHHPVELNSNALFNEHQTPWLDPLPPNTNQPP